MRTLSLVVRHSAPTTPRFQSPPAMPFNSASDAFQLQPRRPSLLIESESSSRASLFSTTPPRLSRTSPRRCSARRTRTTATSRCTRGARGRCTYAASAGASTWTRLGCCLAVTWVRRRGDPFLTSFHVIKPLTNRIIASRHVARRSFNRPRGRRDAGPVARRRRREILRGPQRQRRRGRPAEDAVVHAAVPPGRAAYSGSRAGRGRRVHGVRAQLLGHLVGAGDGSHRERARRGRKESDEDRRVLARAVHAREGGRTRAREEDSRRRRRRAVVTSASSRRV